MNDSKRLGRRNFLKASALGMLGAGFSLKNAGGEENGENPREQTPKIREYRILGRTGFRVSDIGGGFLNDAGLIGAMLDAGVNYIDTAESYGNQRTIGTAIKDRNRKELFVTSKLELKKDLSKQGFIQRARKCLEELQTDYVDCMMMHMPDKAEMLKTEGFHTAMQELKAEGRVRFVGVSHHGSFWLRAPEETMEKILTTAAEDGRFDVFLMAYNFLQMDQSERVLRLCREKKIGTTLMKTNPVAKYYGLKERIEAWEKEGREIHELYSEGLGRFKEKTEKAEDFLNRYGRKNLDEISDAAVQFVLSNPDVNTVCCSMRTYDELDRFVRLSGTRLDDDGQAALAAFREGCGDLYCRHACGVCEPHCPSRVPVNTIMRYNHYFEAQGREKYAMAKYQALSGPKASLCGNCPGYCESACPYNVPVRGRLILAHRQLTLTG